MPGRDVETPALDRGRARIDREEPRGVAQIADTDPSMDDRSGAEMVGDVDPRPRVVRRVGGNIDQADADAARIRFRLLGRRRRGTGKRVGSREDDPGYRGGEREKYTSHSEGHLVRRPSA